MRAKSELETEREKREEKCSKRRKTELKWSPKGLQNPLKNHQKRGPKINVFLVQNGIQSQTLRFALWFPSGRELAKKET